VPSRTAENITCTFVLDQIVVLSLYLLCFGCFHTECGPLFCFKFSQSKKKINVQFFSTKVYAVCVCVRIYAYMYICMYVCMYVCEFVCVRACVRMPFLFKSVCACAAEVHVQLSVHLTRGVLY
jgi:hypothetical protein